MLCLTNASIEHSLSQLKLKYAQVELEAAARSLDGNGGVATYEVGPSAFLFAGIELEDMQ